MRSPWHRSRLFWSGLAGLVMLLVVWGDLRKASCSMELSVRGYLFYLTNSPADFELGYVDHTRLFHKGRYDASLFDWRKVPHDPFIYDEIVGTAFNSEISAGSIYLYIAIWLVVAVYVVLWIIVMLWWQRRKHRMMHLLGRGKIPGQPARGSSVRFPP